VRGGGSRAVIGFMVVSNIALWGLIDRVYRIQDLMIIVSCGLLDGSLSDGTILHCQCTARSHG